MFRVRDGARPWSAVGMSADSMRGMDMSPHAGGAKMGHVPRHVQQMDIVLLCPPLAAKNGHVPRGGGRKMGMSPTPPEAGRWL